MANVGDLLVAEARKHLGKPYVWATSGPNTFDCSGFTYYVTKQVRPNYVIYQGTESQRYLGTVVPLSSARPGDFVFYVDPVGSTTVTHVGIYVSPTELIHAQNESTGVLINNGITGSWFAGRIYQVRRLFPYDDAQSGGTTPPPTGGSGYATNDLIQVIDGPLNMCSGAGTSYSIVTSLAAATQLCVTGASVLSGGYEWVPVKVTGGTTTGWVAKQFTGLVSANGCYTAPPPSPPPSTNMFSVNDKAYVPSGPLNMRSSASTSGSIVGTAPTNADVCIVGGPKSANGYIWWQIKYGSVTGWSVQNFLAMRTVQGCATTTPTPPPPTTTTWTHKAYPSALNFRQTPSVTSTLIGTLPVNDRVQWLKDSNGSYITTSAGGYLWCNVKSERYGVTGWCVNGLEPL